MNTLEAYGIAGREEETVLFEQVLASNNAELLAVYGRRRIGKTFLIRTVFANHIVFELSGTLDTSAPQQLYNFSQAMGKYQGIVPATPANWQEAFTLLIKYLESLRGKKKKVIFFDELPWLDTMHSGFLAAFDYFWNSWCTRRNDVVAVICGSAASWMINKIVNNKGGLHNRITRQVRLLPFTLAETQQFFALKKVKLDQYQIAQLYMVMGGVPHYLNEVKPGKSAQQNIDAICFAKNGLLRNEFENLYHALYNNADIHISIIRALASKRIGLLRTEITAIAKLQSGGYLTAILTELIESGFVASYTPLDRKTKETVYRLADEFSLFYLKFIEKAKSFSAGTWAAMAKSLSYISWSGYAFENLCLKHVQKVKDSLGIGAIYTEQSAWYDKTEKAQIDLVINRADHCTNICEMKFATTPYELTATDAAALQHKKMAYQANAKNRNTIFTTLITTYGLKPNEHSLNHVDNEVVLKDLF